MKYNEIRDTLKTGDIVLFSGKGGISDVIKYFSASKFSHIGMVMKIPEYDFLACWESTTLSNLVNLENGEPTKGVQLVSLHDRINSYDGVVCVRKLCGERLTRDKLDKLVALRHELKGRPYERSQMELFRSLYDGWGGKNEKDLSSIFCSEMTAEAYQAMGILSKALPSNEFTPADFTEKVGIDLLGDFYLGPEIKIDK